MKKKLEEKVIQEFSHRCPYCDHPISYDEIDLKSGENEIECPSCKRIFIKVVSDHPRSSLGCESYRPPPSKGEANDS
jgi:DNA-directed RNA polymerase subunit RPC12/RpoP